MISSIDCQIVTIDNKPVHGYNGIKISPTQSVNLIEAPDVVIVSSSVKVVIDCNGDDFVVEKKTQVKQWLQHCHNKGSVFASSCTGSFVLADCGFLEGKTATTHWRSADMFRRNFPFIRH
ncbi:MAG: DJ-1/PfpI family protein [Alteromonadaceae bacterium]|nr:DJ-1/PfpI family protein [Alteromonadaceae bacterium]